MHSQTTLSSVSRWLAVASLMLAGAGCTLSHTAEVGEGALRRVGLASQQKVSRVHAFVLPAGSSVYVGHPSIGAVSQHPKPRLRTQLQLALLDSSTRYGLAAVAGPYQQSLAEGLLQADLYDTDFLFSAHFTESNKDGTGAHRRVRLVVNIYDVRSRTLVDTVTVSAERGAIRADGDDDVLAASAQAFIQSVYRRPSG